MWSCSALFPKRCEDRGRQRLYLVLGLGLINSDDIIMSSAVVAPSRPVSMACARVVEIYVADMSTSFGIECFAVVGLGGLKGSIWDRGRDGKVNRGFIPCSKQRLLQRFLL